MFAIELTFSNAALTVVEIEDCVGGDAKNFSSIDSDFPSIRSVSAFSSGNGKIQAQSVQQATFAEATSSLASQTVLSLLNSLHCVLVFYYASF